MGTNPLNQKLKGKMKIFIIIILFASICFGIRPDYFQQHVAYDIEVTLDDSAHTLQAFEKIVYTNNSPDTLDFFGFIFGPMPIKILRLPLPNNGNGS